ncbi:hypothetical protein NUU44_24245 [Escherichia coli]|nr:MULTISPECIES: hypothetical protein [Enterobacteriaceae]MCR4236476.1 hypothetical protein [Escherichia coli]
MDGGQREAERGEAGTGVEQDDRAGNTVAERIRAVTRSLPLTVSGLCTLSNRRSAAVRQKSD